MCAFTQAVCDARPSYVNDTIPEASRAACKCGVLCCAGPDQTCDQTAQVGHTAEQQSSSSVAHQLSHRLQSVHNDPYTWHRHRKAEGFSQVASSPRTATLTLNMHVY